MLHQPAGIQVTPLFDPDQIWKLRRGKGACALPGEDASRNREMDRLNLRCGEPLKPGVGIGPQPGGRERYALFLPGFREEFFFIFSLRRIVSQSKESHLLYRTIALCASDYLTVRHDAAITFRA